MSGPSRNEPNPVYVTYTYTTARKQSEEEDSASVFSSRYSAYSHCSAIGSLSSTQRINELRPKSKIVISKCSTLANTKRKSETQAESSSSKISVDSTPLFRRSEIIITESMEYDTLKPFFNWNKFSFLCGFETFKMGEHGCLCNEVCPWKKEWTKSVHKHDLLSFKKIIAEKAKKENLTQIEKDITRTHPQCPTFAKNIQYRLMLKNVLIAYSIYDIEMGYVQGINMIAGVLLYHIKNTEQTFWALVQMMEYQELRLVYLDNFEHLRAHCQNINNILMSKVNDLYNHMNELEIISDCFLNGWLLSLMSNAIPMEYMHEVLDKFRKKGWRYIYQLIVTYLLFLKDFLLISSDQAEFLSNLSSQSSREVGVEWREMIETAEKLIL